MPEVYKANSGDHLCLVGSTQMSDVHLPSSRLGIQGVCLAVGGQLGVPQGTLPLHPRQIKIGAMQGILITAPCLWSHEGCSL